MKGPPQGPRLHIDIPRVQLLIEDKEGIKQLGKHRALPAAWGPSSTCLGKEHGPASCLAPRSLRFPQAVPFLPYSGAGCRGVLAAPLMLLLAQPAAPAAISLVRLCLGGGYCHTTAWAGEQSGKSPIPTCPGMLTAYSKVLARERSELQLLPAGDDKATIPVTDTEFSQAVNPQSFCTGVSLHHPALIQNTGPLIDMSDIRPGTSKRLWSCGAGLGLLATVWGACRHGHQAGVGKPGTHRTGTTAGPCTSPSRGVLLLPHSRVLGCRPCPPALAVPKSSCG